MDDDNQPHLHAPIGPDDHAVGPEDAALTLVEYGDYECPSCGQAHGEVGVVRERLGERLRFVFRNFPLKQIHPHAQHAAEAAEVAGMQGRFWPMHDLLFANQEALTDADLARYAEEIGLDVDRFGQELASHALAERVRTDFMGGVRAGVNGTPTFFVNGVRHDGAWDAESLVAALEGGG